MIWRIVLLIAFVIFVIAWVGGSIIIINMIARDIAESNNIAKSITDNGGTIIASTTIMVWKDSGDNVHSGFTIDGKQYELKIIVENNE